MGQTLSEPITDKSTDLVRDENFTCGASSMQGWRITMEDAHVVLLKMPTDENASFFAVYDGHGGAKVSKHAELHLHNHIASRPEFKKGETKKALSDAFLDFDRIMMNDENLREDMAGTTAITVLIRNGKVFCSNVGDSRAVACINGRMEPLSFDHKPNNPEEAARITKAGGFVEFNRVNGNLALSRALGDFIFKRNNGLRAEEQMVSPLPDITEKPFDKSWEFMILACDGIWDVLSNEEAVEFVRRRLARNMTPDKICEDMMMACLAPDCQMGGIGCDNMTVVLVCFLHGMPFEELGAKMAVTPPLILTDPSIPRGTGILDISDDEDEDETSANANSINEEMENLTNEEKSTVPVESSATVTSPAPQQTKANSPNYASHPQPNKK